MWLTDDDIKEFQGIWKAEFGEEITVAQARERATNLLELYRLLAKHAARQPNPHPPQTP